MTKMNRETRNERNRQMASGVLKHFTSPIVLNGVSHTPAETAAILTDPVAKTDATIAAEGAFHQAVTAEKTSTATANAAFLSVKGQVLNLYKGQPTVLADFGIAEHVRKVTTAAEKAAAAAKRKARAAAKKAALATANAAVTTPTATTAAQPAPAAAPVTTPKA